MNSQPNQTPKPEEKSFRDSIATVDDKGKRIWVYPKKPSGWFHNRRAIVSIVFLAILFIGPFIRIGGEPLFLANILERKFVILGKVFWPQDFYLFVVAMLTGVVFIALFTVVFGRVFCGWICPQTIFMEMFFRKIEYWVEGDWTAQKALNKKKGSAEYYRKKTIKHTLFFGFSFLIANTFLAYIIGSDELIAIVIDDPANHTAGLLSITIFTAVFYGVFAGFREQVCTVVCPYGRFQGALLGPDSMVVAYDHVRGEGRAKIKKNEDRTAAGKGDCIDCHQCVNVCPTGIDIRNGTQLECINCTACIDACDYMMENVGLEKGLIRYASENSIAKKEPFRFTTRMKAYTVLLAGLMLAMTALLVGRSDLDVKVLRTPGLLYQKQDEGQISNLFNYKIINKTKQPLDLELRLVSHQGRLQMVGDDLKIEGGDMTDGAFFVFIAEKDLPEMKNEIEIGVYSNGVLLETANINFLGPVK